MYNNNTRVVYSLPPGLDLVAALKTRPYNGRSPLWNSNHSNYKALLVHTCTVTTIPRKISPISSPALAFLSLVKFLSRIRNFTPVEDNGGDLCTPLQCIGENTIECFYNARYSCVWWILSSKNFQHFSALAGLSTLYMYKYKITLPLAFQYSCIPI